MPTKKAMRATPANVSRLLTAANHQKQRPYPSAIRGWKNWTSGFRCDARADEKTGVSFVEVRCLVDGYYDPAPEHAKRARLERYLPALQEHFQCAVSDAGGCLVLTVRERQAT